MSQDDAGRISIKDLIENLNLPPALNVRSIIFNLLIHQIYSFIDDIFLTSNPSDIFIYR